jgi:hypothetical protein
MHMATHHYNPFNGKMHTGLFGRVHIGLSKWLYVVSANIQLWNLKLMDFEEYNEFGGSKVLREAILRGKRGF